ncbi:efflux RND transporter periplasmic adaptor subunit [Alkanindiges sp. WGS2144]|uniref:efflux RND transporter periplasmic adaptor subunit n=1 Tax=Alkanindiges sp. WGS2144 TaxID=3366808 RepID=UPI00375392DB
MLVKSKPLKIFLVIITLFVMAVIGWKFLKPKEQKPQYITAQVSREDIEEAVLATGVLQAQQLVSVGAQVSGQVRKMYVKLGEQVKQGQLIAQIDSVRQENELRNQQAAINNLEAQKATRLATLKEAELNFKRQKDMLAQDATSRAEYESAQAGLETARANIKAIDAQIEQTRLAVSTAQENVGYTRIVAPINGTVVAIVTEEGQTVNANQSAPTIVKLAQLQTMTIKAQVSEADVMRINQGQTVYFTTLGEPDKKIYASLRAIEPAPDSIITDSNNSTSSSGSNSAIYYNALFDVPNPDGKLRIDMTAQVYIVLNEARNVLSIPAAAIQSMGSKGSKRSGRQKTSSKTQEAVQPEQAPTGGKAGTPATVRVIDEEGNAVPRQVQIGLNNRVSAQVISGLKEGEEVVIADSSDTSNSAAKRSGNSRPMRF